MTSQQMLFVPAEMFYPEFIYKKKQRNKHIDNQRYKYKLLLQIYVAMYTLKSSLSVSRCQINGILHVLCSDLLCCQHCSSQGSESRAAMFYLIQRAVLRTPLHLRSWHVRQIQLPASINPISSFFFWTKHYGCIDSLSFRFLHQSSNLKQHSLTCIKPEADVSLWSRAFLLCTSGKTSQPWSISVVGKQLLTWTLLCLCSWSSLLMTGTCPDWIKSPGGFKKRWTRQAVYERSLRPGPQQAGGLWLRLSLQKYNRTKLWAGSLLPTAKLLTARTTVSPGNMLGIDF